MMRSQSILLMLNTVNINFMTVVLVSDYTVDNSDVKRGQTSEAEAEDNFPSQ